MRSKLVWRTSFIHTSAAKSLHVISRLIWYLKLISDRNAFAAGVLHGGVRHERPYYHLHVKRIEDKRHRRESSDVIFFHDTL